MSCLNRRFEPRYRVAGELFYWYIDARIFAQRKAQETDMLVSLEEENLGRLSNQPQFLPYRLIHKSGAPRPLFDPASSNNYDLGSAAWL